MSRSLAQSADREAEDMGAPRKPYEERVADKLLSLIASGTSPWQKGWTGKDMPLRPMNPESGAAYRGANWLVLTMEGRADPRWMTFKQAAAAGYNVRKGEKGTQLTYWKSEDERPKLDSEGRQVKRSDGSAEKEVVALSRPRQFFFTVFNAEQMDGVPELGKAPTEVRYPAITAAIQASGVRVLHSDTSGACYRPGLDTIMMPSAERFKSTEEYYSTALHELGHATGHPQRLNRDLSNPFGSAGYAREELRAEMASMMMASTFGVAHDPSRHAAYVGNWLQIVSNDPKEVFRAARDAGRIADYVESLSKHVELASDVPLPSLVADGKMGVAGDLDSAELAEHRAALATPDDWTALACFDLYGGLYEARSLAGGLEPTDALRANEGLSRVGVALGTGDYSAALAEVKVLSSIDGGEPFTRALADIESGARVMSAKGGAIPVAIAAGREGGDAVGSDRTWLNVSYHDRNEAKEHGARWDKERKSWFAPEGADLQALAKWLPQNTPSVSEVVDATAELAAKLREEGFRLDGDPIFDGEFRRVPVEGDRRGEVGGGYVAFEGKTPAGYMVNYRTGVELNWSASSIGNLSPEERQEAKLDAEIRRAARQAEANAQHATAVAAYQELLLVAPPASPENAYAVSKGVSVGDLKEVPSAFVSEFVVIAQGRKEAAALRESHPNKAVLTAGDLIVPMAGPTGELTGIQTIGANGFKMLAKGSAGRGASHTINGKGAIAVVEGWATARTVHELTGWTVVASIMASNMPAVTETVHASNSGSVPLLVLGEDDRGVEAAGRKNVGREYATQAAEAVGAHVAFPAFDPKEKGTDWNDFATVRGVVPATNALMGELDVANSRAKAAELLNKSAVVEAKHPEQAHAAERNKKGRSVTKDRDDAKATARDVDAAHAGPSAPAAVAEKTVGPKQSRRAR